jgi:hypothetical protein
MSIYVNTNAQSVFAQRALSQNTNGLQKILKDYQRVYVLIEQQMTQQVYQLVKN